MVEHRVSGPMDLPSVVVVKAKSSVACHVMPSFAPGAERKPSPDTKLMPGDGLLGFPASRTTSYSLKDPALWQERQAAMVGVERYGNPGKRGTWCRHSPNELAVVGFGLVWFWF